MKRSEMVEIIANKIAEFRNTEPTRNDLFVASAILTEIENEGMMPPQNGNNYESYGSGDDYFCTSTPAYEWGNE